MVAVQTEGCAPIVRAFEHQERFAEPWEKAETRAGGIRVPSAVGDFLILDAIRESGGTAVAVTEHAMDEAQRVAGRRGAGYVSPETGAVIASLAVLRDLQWLDPDERVVVFDTGVGQKYPPPPDLDRPPVLAADADQDPERLLAAAT